MGETYVDKPYRMFILELSAHIVAEELPLPGEMILRYCWLSILRNAFGLEKDD
jgi:hypothetical protein